MKPIWKTSLAVVSAMLLGASVAPTPSSASEVVSVRLLRNGVVQSNARVSLVLSYGIESAQTDARGIASTNIRYGRGFWVIVDGQMLDQFYFVKDGRADIDLAEVRVLQLRKR